MLCTSGFVRDVISSYSDGPHGAFVFSYVARGQRHSRNYCIDSYQILLDDKHQVRGLRTVAMSCIYLIACQKDLYRAAGVLNCAKALRCLPLITKLVVITLANGPFVVRTREYV